MIRVAKKHSVGYTNIEFRVADATGWEPFDGEFDCIAPIATVHHLPMEEILAKMRKALKVKGMLTILDL
jgi:2-polyprenyl-3-methyl-5-hydroxy-6-metoxy-1,4-benzoquinol methylase